MRAVFVGRSLMAAILCVWFACSVRPAAAAIPAYSFALDINRNDGLCRHMLGVFNERFLDMWRADGLAPSTSLPALPASRYAFPALPGMDVTPVMNFQMRWSRVPSSPEFDAIEWNSGALDQVGPKGVPPSPGSTHIPFLVAYFDFDNDGRADTVLKQTFTMGYDELADSRFPGQPVEVIWVWRAQQLTFEHDTALWPLLWELPSQQAPLRMQGSLLRPFRYEGKTYIARYEVTRASAAARASNFFAESMRIIQPSHHGDGGPRDQNRDWAARTVCVFKMFVTNE